jgi:hypothetical protein
MHPPSSRAFDGSADEDDVADAVVGTTVLLVSLLREPDVGAVAADGGLSAGRPVAGTAGLSGDLTFTSTAGLPEDVTLTSTSLRGDLTEDVTLAPVKGLPGDLHSWCVAESGDTLLLRRCAEDVGGDSDEDDDDDDDDAEDAVSTTASTPFTADTTADIPSGDDGNGDDGSDAGASDACGAGGARGFSDKSAISDDVVVSIAVSDKRAFVTPCLTLCAFFRLTDAVNAVISSTDNSARMPAAQRRAAATSSAQVSHRSGGVVPFSVVSHSEGGLSPEGRAVGLSLDSSSSVLVFADAFSRGSLSRLG